jgi:dTDP-glucose pyrophosphorylase
MNKMRIKTNSTLKDVMGKLNLSGSKCLVVVNNNDELIGTISNGDLRKAILKGSQLDDCIDNILNPSPISLTEEKFKISLAKDLFLKYKFDIIPITDKYNILKRIIKWDEIFGPKKIDKILNDIPVIVMAGGRGKRLKPFTDILPKPLIPINGKPVIQIILEKFKKFGSEIFYVSVNHKAYILKAFFRELEYNINFIEEVKPLGTCGSLYLVKDKIHTPFFVVNCDIIIDVDYSSLLKFHLDGCYDLTLVASTKQHIIPYGACELNKDGSLSKINEKPKLNFLINTGLYILESKVLNFIPKNTFFHITNLIDILINLDKKIGVFPVNDDLWTDVGQWVEYDKAIRELK